MKYYILIKKTNSKNWFGAVPAKKNISLKELRSGLASRKKKGFVYKIVNETELKKIVKRGKK